MSLEKTKLQILATSIILCGISTLIFSRYVVDNFNIPKLPLIIAAGMTSLFSLALFSLIKLEPKNKKILFSALPFFLFTLTFMISWIFGPASLAKGFFGSQGRLNGFALYGSLAIVAISIIMLYVNKLTDLFDKVFIAVIALETTYCLIQLSGRDPINWDFSNIGERAILGTFGNPNFVSSFMGIATVYLAISSFRFSSRSFGKWGRVFLAILTGWITFESGSLQGNLLILIGFYLFIITVFSYKLTFLPKFSKIFIFANFVLGVILLLALSGNLGNFNYLRVETLVYRLEYMKIGLRMFAENPLFGVGIDSFSESFRQYRSFEDFQVIPFVLVDNPHNSIISLAACSGILVAASKVLILCYIALRITRHLSNGQPIDLPLITNALCWALFELQAMISIDSPGLAPWSWIFASIVIGRLNSIEDDQNVPRLNEIKSRRLSNSDSLIIKKWILTTVTTLSLIFSWQVVVGKNKDLKILRVYSDNSSGVPNEVVNEEFVRNLYRFYSYDSAYSRIITSYSFNIGLNNLGEEISVSTLGKFPSVYEVLNLRAKLLEVTERSSQATKLRERALVIEPFFEESYINFASNLLLNGNRQEAVEVLESGVKKAFTSNSISNFLKLLKDGPRIGLVVQHNNYGVGAVVDVTKDKITVKFSNEGIGEKVFDLSTAPLAYNR